MSGTSFRGSLLVCLSLAGVACGMTLLFLGMRAVMQVGGACAEGGAYVVAQPCPSGVPAVIFGGLWGGLACLGIYAVMTSARGVPSLLPFAWPALFLSLGWNFLEFAVRPPGGGGVAWAWLLCGVVFVLMGAVPLWISGGPAVRRLLGGGAAASEARRRDAGVRRPMPSALEPAPAGVAAAGAEGAPPPPAGAGEDLVQALERLASLHRGGALDDAEYRAGKERILGSGGTP